MQNLRVVQANAREESNFPGQQVESEKVRASYESFRLSQEIFVSAYMYTDLRL